MIFLLIPTFISSRPSGVGNNECEGTEWKPCPMIHGKKRRYWKHSQEKISSREVASNDKSHMQVMSRGQGTLYNTFTCVEAFYKRDHHLETKENLLHCLRIRVSLSAMVMQQQRQVPMLPHFHWKKNLCPFYHVLSPFVFFTRKCYSLYHKKVIFFNLTKEKHFPITHTEILCQSETIKVVKFLQIS